jgi:acetolactate synthase-1/2/3 large subunit
MRLVDCRNEQTASYIADAYGRLTRVPGVCAVSSGVAHVNALAGVANAWFDSGPILLISGAASTATAGKGHFQEMDQVAIAGPLCKVARSVLRPQDIAASLSEALTTGFPYAPAHLTFPMDVQNSEVPEADLSHPAIAKDLVMAADVDADSVAAALASSQAPVMIAGTGVFYSDSGPEMLAFCDRYKVPVVTPIWDRGSVPAGNAVFAGIVGAATGGPAVLSEADCILVAGAVSDYRVGYFEPPAIRPEARVVGLGNNWSEVDDACRKSSVPPRADWLAKCLNRRDEFRAQVESRGKEQGQSGLHAIHIIQAIQGILSENPVLLIDGGSIGQWAHQMLCSDRYPSDWLTCGRSGVVGWGIGGGMAARLAFPDRPVVLLSGDGAFTFNIADIESAARQGLGFVAIVADDQGWGITRTGHIRQFGMPIASSLGHIAFDQVATALGARGVRVSTAEAIKTELWRAIHDPSMTVIHVPVVGGNPA